MADEHTCDDHTYGPATYAAWHDWAEKMSRTHVCSQCPECGLWKIWTPRESGQDIAPTTASQNGSSGGEQ